MGTVKLPNGLEVVHLNRGETLFLYDDVFVAGTYLSHGLSLRPDDIVFDVGANIGLATLFFWTRQPTVQIFAFEPLVPAFEALCANIEKHGCRAKALNIGLAATSRRAPFTMYINNSLMSGLHADVDDDTRVTETYMVNSGFEAAKARDLLHHTKKFASKVVQVELRTLSDVIRAERVERIDLLKIDVEKAEGDVLAGIDAEHWNLIRQLVIEVHDIAGRLAHVTALLEARGYAVRSMQEPALRGTDIYNLFAVAHHVAPADA
jgi:FkbM family methyltransferase